MKIDVGSICRITVAGQSLNVRIRAIYCTAPWDIEYDILTPRPGRGSYGRWKQNMDGGIIQLVS